MTSVTTAVGYTPIVYATQHIFMSGRNIQSTNGQITHLEFPCISRRITPFLSCFHKNLGLKKSSAAVLLSLLGEKITGLTKEKGKDTLSSFRARSLYCINLDPDARRSG